MENQENPKVWGNEFQERKPLKFVYKNWKEEVEVRRVIPREIRYTSTEYHPQPQWIMIAFDVEKEAVRQFAMKDILYMFND